MVFKAREFYSLLIMIDGIGGIYGSAYKTGDSKKTALATDFHKITDIGDEYELEASVDKDWDGVNSQRVTAHVYRFVAGQKGEEITSSLKGTFTHTFASSIKNTERGMPNVPTFESLSRMMEPEHLWPQSDAWIS